MGTQWEEKIGAVGWGAVIFQSRSYVRAVWSQHFAGKVLALCFLARLPQTDFQSGYNKAVACSDALETCA